MLNNIGDMTDADKKTLMNLMIEKIEIFPEKQKDGRWVKSIQFKIPLNIDGRLVDILETVDEDDDENSLPEEKHVETVVLLSQLKQKPDDYINVTIELDDVDITSAETKATYDEIKKYVAEHNAGMKVSNLYISQVKKKCGIEVGKNYNLPKNEDSRQPQCPEDKERAIVEALEHFKMIQQE